MQNNFNNPYVNPAPNMYNARLNQYTFVNGLEGAKSFQVQPNQTVMLLDSDNPIIYKKSANSYGQASIEYFQMIPISEQDVRNILTPPMPEYVLKSDFDKLMAKLDALTSKKEADDNAKSI